MKYFLKSITALAVIALAAISCQTPVSPSDVAVKFTKQMMLANFDSTTNYVTSGSKSLLSLTEESYKNGPQIPDSVKQILNQATVTAAGETKIDDTTTSVALSVTLPQAIMGMTVTKQNVVLIKEKGEWKVDLLATMKKAKEDMGMPADQPMPATANDTVPPTPPDTGAAPKK